MKKYDGTLIASYLVLEKKGKILLLRRFNTGWHDGDYSLIAGHVKRGESALQAVVREAKEEAGVVVQEKGVDFVHIAHRNKTKDNNGYIDFYFKTKKWQGEIKMGESCDRLDWFSPNKLPNNIIPVVSEILREISEGSRYSEYGWIK